MNVSKLGFALLLGLCFSGYASASCTNATLVGNYGFTVTGVDSSGELAASVGHYLRMARETSPAPLPTAPRE